MSGGALHVESGPENKLRIDIDGSLRLLPDSTDATGSFYLRGSIILRPQE